MSQDQLAVRVSIIATFLLGAVASLVPLDWAWGLNHLQFLPPWFTWIYLTLAIVAVVVLLLPLKLTALDSIVESTDRILWGEKHWPKVAFALAFIPLFYFLRVETHFLGDGYGWLGNLSHEASYIQKWTSHGSLAVVRYVQSIIGSQSERTALIAFQIVSISSGAITVYNISSIVKRLCSGRGLRLFGIIVIMTGGALLLFCGYVEVYPILWAAATTWLSLSIRYLQESKGLGWVIVAYAVSLLMHVQAIYFLPGFFWLVAGRMITRRRVLRITRTYWISFGMIVFVGGAILYWLRAEDLELEMMLLPLIVGRPASPDYAVFSLKHLVDIGNLYLLIVPASLPLLFLSRPWRWLSRLDTVTIFLVLSGAGSFLFLLIIDPVIGLARDWDLASFTILCPTLLLLRGCQLSEGRPTPRILVATLLLGLTISGGYLATNLNVPSSEERFHGLLSHYGSKDYGGWTVYSNYLRKIDRTEEADSINTAVGRLFPNEVLLSQAIDMLRSGDANGALRLAQNIVEEEPYNAGSLALIGQVYASRKQYGKAEEYLDRAIRLRPHFPSFLNTIAHIYFNQKRYAEALESSRKASAGAPDKLDYQETLGLAHYYTNHLDSAALIARSSLQDDSCASHSNLLMLMIAVARSDQPKAKHYYRIYEQCGPLTPEYQSILREFRYVVED